MIYENLEFKAIEKSRDLYFSSGSLRRYTLRTEIANSWIRYNLFKYKDINKANKENNKLRNIMIFIKSIENDIRRLNFKIYLILDNECIFKFIYDDNEKFYSTGAEISNKIKDDFTVFKNEHISNIFSKKFTHGFRVMKNNGYYFTIGIESDIENYSIENIKKIRDIIDNINIEKKENIDSFSFLDCKSIYDKINNFNSPLLLIGESGVGKYYFVNFLKEKYYAEYKFKVINCSRIDDIEKCFKVKHKTVFYFEKLEFLDFAEQKKLAKIIESKYVYSSSEKHTDFKEIVVITSVKNDIEFIRNYGTINERLLTRLTPNSYAFKPLREYDKNVIIDWIENGINKFLSSNVKIVISEMLWKNNFYDLKKFVSFINEKSRNEIVEVNDLPKSAFLKNADIVTIKEAEKKLVVKTIEEYNKNITLCARSLGISRSTLYRKINDYNILL